ncbi:zinc finger protein 235-like isoform X1 [Mercenaria mercenaria]|uniref:zinc finger protein 235-like isoform X1 n=1 Tax=Mercenaria mercenaria TaxID=6596 RepID=UPI00234EB1D1|nr:zinc finger protein 235-like isoform X1 [Mercenaria mercenaria]
MQEKRYGKMDKYLLTIMVTFEQEYAIQKLFGRHGWEYSKITDEISLKDFKSGEKSSPEIQPELNQQSCVKKTVASDSSKIVTSNDDKDSSNTPRHETAIPAVKFSMQNDVNNMLDNSINSEADAYHNDEGDGDDDYGGDTDTEQTLMSLGIVVKEELESGDDDDKASEHDVDSINKRSSNVKPSGKGKRSAQSKAETRNKKKRKQATSTVPSAEVEDNVDKGESEVKLEGLSAEDQGTDDPLAVLETLPDIEHVSKVVSSNTHDVETFLTGPDDVDESGYSVSLSLYFCRDCQYTFPEEKYYTLHKRSGKCVFQCQFCDKKYTFKNFSQYQEHLKQHSVGWLEEPVVDLEDDVALDDELDKNENSAVLTSTSPQFEHSQLNAGTGSSSGEPERKKLLYCKVCSYSTAKRGNMYRHKKSKHEDRLSVCDQCSKTFKEAYDLRQHQRCVHDNIKLLCEFCSKEFNSRQTLQRHKLIYHLDSKPKHECHICNKKFFETSTYRGHMNTHMNARPYSCLLCNKAFAYKFSLQRHNRSCSSQNMEQYKCKVCSKQLKSPACLQEHTEGVHGPKDKVCACGERFSWRSSLTRHQKSCKVLLK